MRTRVRRRAVALIAAAATLWAVGGPVAEAVGLGDGPAAAGRTHVVRPGETLWSIARAVEPGRDPREVVFELRRANHVDPAGLVPGDRLALPVF